MVPKPGTAIFWYNILPSREGDQKVRHGACPVLAGEKYIATKWFHERGNEHIFEAYAEKPRLQREWQKLALNGVDNEDDEDAAQVEQVVEAAAEDIPCQHVRAAGRCTAEPLDSARRCPGWCEERLVESKLRGRLVRESVLSKDVTDHLMSLAPEVVVPGDGYQGKHPFSNNELFAGVTPIGAARWAQEQPTGEKRKKAEAWVRAYIEAAHEGKRHSEDGFGKKLYFDYIHLVCRRHTAKSFASQGSDIDSHPAHADNCFRLGSRCVRDKPYYYWRSHSAILFIHGPESGDFEGGDFFYSPDFDSDPSLRVSVAPRAGRMVAFSAGPDNIHGVWPVTRGIRCVVALWFTDDRSRAGALTELEHAERLLQDEL
eukprot:gnl/TRDRNA2_/TRDRNA2_146004_c0_seq1.p1 gnl/TRDRNA2_/TRDRNA2_146004_c0~~gnl/TRDRNA2_/TRDRNA2_146004_c0_seq1.p1  ORF type:complete len:431 (+),score=55.22 gnl/TRDRNA2_/TRDRNA2_146004_c0_seq1:178-1293(+)